MKIIISLFIVLFSLNVEAAGIRWRDHYPFHKPDRVVVGEYIGKYDGPFNEGGTGYLKGQSLVKVDNLSTPFNTFRYISIPDLAGLGMSLVKRLGPMMLLGSLGSLVWDEISDYWKKLNDQDHSYVGGSVADGTACNSTGIGHVVVGSNGTACKKVCRCARPESPWAWKNNATWDSANRYGACTNMCGSPNPYWPEIWVRTSPAYDPGYVPATDSDILNALMNYLNNINNWLDFINKLDAQNMIQTIIDAATPHHMNGPDTTSRTENSSSTGPDGTTLTSKHYQYSYTYNNYSVSLILTITTTITYPDNSTKTTVDTYQPVTGGGGTDDPPPDQVIDSDICKENPEILACWGAGTIEDQTIPEVDKPLTISSEKTSAGTCPSPITFTVRGHIYSVSWQPICTFASTLRPLVILLAWLTAGIFVFYTLSRA